MKRKIIITEAQIEAIQKRLPLSANIDTDIDYNNNPYNSNKIFDNFINKTLIKDICDISLKNAVDNVSIYNDDSEHFNEILSQVILKVQEIESAHKEELEKLSIKYIHELFKDFINDNIEIECHLGSTEAINPPNINMEIDSIPEYANILKSIDKYEFIKMLSNGISNKNMFVPSIINNELYNIHPQLIGMYDKIIRINNLLLYNGDGLKNNNICGSVRVIKSECGTIKIIAYANIFPLLINELLQGILEIETYKNIEDKNKLNFIQKSINDKYDDIWANRIGNSLINNYFNDIDIYTMTEIISGLSQIECNAFISIFKEIINNTNTGKKLLNSIKNNAIKSIKIKDIDNKINSVETKDHLDVSDIMKL